VKYRLEYNYAGSDQIILLIGRSRTGIRKYG